MTRRLLAAVSAALASGYLLGRFADDLPAAVAPVPLTTPAYVRCFDGFGVQVWAGFCERLDVAGGPKRADVVGRCTAGGHTQSVRKVRRCGVGR